MPVQELAQRQGDDQGDHQDDHQRADHECTLGGAGDPVNPAYP
jgi:hypothetical protein